MLTQLQLEGPELEPLLARVRNELGPSARIVHAEKIRSGGVAGFFARQRFELTVEVDPSVPRAPAARPAVAVPAHAGAHAPGQVTAGVTAGQVTAGQVTAGQVTAGQVTAGQVTAGQVSAGQVAAGQVTAGVPARAVAPREVTSPVGSQLAVQPAPAAPAPFTAIAGLDGDDPETPSLFSAIAGMGAPAESPLTSASRPARPAVQPSPGATAAAHVYASTTAPSDALPSSPTGASAPPTTALPPALLAAAESARPVPGAAGAAIVVPAAVPSAADESSALSALLAGLAEPAEPVPAATPAQDEPFAPFAAFADVASAAATAPEEPVTPAGPARPQARSLLELAEQVSAEEQAGLVSTESTSFAALLSSLGSAMGAPDEQPATLTGGGSVPAQSDSAGDGAAAALAHAAAIPGQRTGAVVDVSVATGEVVAPDGFVAAGEVVAARPADRQPADPHPANPGDQQHAAHPGAAHQQVADQHLAHQQVADQHAGLPAAASAQVEPAGPDDSTGAELARLGLPPHLRPRAVGEQLHAALRTSLTRLPTAPPAVNRAGSVLAIVGPLSLALHVAREIAEELGLPVATSVAVATSGAGTSEVAERQVLHGTDEAAERRATWRRRSNLTVVAVDAPLTATGAAEARAFLAALSPSATWGAVEATRKAQDVAAWTRALGGVHALALTDVEDTADPAAVLELGIPVSRLGGRPATPRAWATLLTGRLAA